MLPDYLTEDSLNEFIDRVLAEDIGAGDFSTLACIPSFWDSQAKMIAKDKGVIAGVELAKRIFHRVDKNLMVEVFFQDGQKVEYGDIILTVKGKTQSILTSERLALNCVQRMSGIASYTAQLCGLIAHTKASLLDTRKTTPGFRAFEKWAVKIGGGQNHRLGLYDMIMLKDNHIDFSGGIKAAISKTLDFLKQQNLTLKIEVETRNLDQVKQVLEVGGVDFIMLDNMDIATIKEAILLIGGRFAIEVSGGVTEKSIVAIAETGVDFISVGALTHSYRSLDLSLKAF
jgi:nicotinate-nucleotide pyrophosphorylase (carboxylating)